MAKNTKTESLFSGVKPVRKPSANLTEMTDKKTIEEKHIDSEIPLKEEPANHPESLDFIEKRPRKTVHKTFLFTEEVARKLEADARGYNVSQGEYLAALIRRGA